MAGDGLPPLREVIAKYDLAARRALGQNFLLDLNLTGKIARAAGDLTAGTTIEVGPGPGGLTRALLSHDAREVIAIERDARCLGALAEIADAYPGRLTIIEGDALAVDCAKLGTAPRSDSAATITSAIGVLAPANSFAAPARLIVPTCDSGAGKRRN